MVPFGASMIELTSVSNLIGQSFTSSIIQTSGYMESSPGIEDAAGTMKSESGDDDIARCHG